MELGTSCQANISSTNPEIPCILWNPEVHYFVDKSLPHVPVLSKINPVPTLIYIREDPIYHYPCVCARWCQNTREIEISHFAGVLRV
jgi:hypothetical protein